MVIWCGIYGTHLHGLWIGGVIGYCGDIGVIWDICLILQVVPRFSSQDAGHTNRGLFFWVSGRLDISNDLRNGGIKEQPFHRVVPKNALFWWLSIPTNLFGSRKKELNKWIYIYIVYLIYIYVCDIIYINYIYIILFLGFTDLHVNWTTWGGEPSKTRCQRIDMGRLSLEFVQLKSQQGL